MKRLVPKSEMVAVQGANVPTKLKATTLRVRQLRILAGPKADLTANAGNVYVGDQKVDTKDGDVLAPGQFSDYEAAGDDEYLDLSDFYIVAPNAGDVVRIHYLRFVEDRP
jgi:hypothetical protein